MISTSPTTVAQHYARMQIETASKAKSICMLHQKCQFLIEQARREPQRRRPILNWAQNILAQLQSSLIVDDQLSESLLLLYDYISVKLDRGSDEDCRNALELAGTLRATFDRLYRTL